MRTDPDIRFLVQGQKRFGESCLRQVM